jgi:hypothetical protein
MRDKNKEIKEKMDMTGFKDGEEKKKKIRVKEREEGNRKRKKRKGNRKVRR